MTGGVSGMITSSAIKVPPGTGVVDFEILDEKAAQLFTNKGDLASQKYIAYPEGDMTLMKQGVKQVHSIRAGTCFLAIKNPSSLNKIIVTVEAVALVAERSPEQERATLIGNIAWKTYERGDIDQALELSKKAIGIYHDLDFAWANIGLIQLTKRELVAAVDSYAIAAALIKQSDNPDRIFRAVIKDLDDLNVQVPNLAGLLDVRQSPVLSSGLKF
jgi:tetratricopeptide (TPR) repeat protein